MLEFSKKLLSLEKIGGKKACWLIIFVYFRFVLTAIKLCAGLKSLILIFKHYFKLKLHCPWRYIFTWVAVPWNSVNTVCYLKRRFAHSSDSSTKVTISRCAHTNIFTCVKISPKGNSSSLCWFLECTACFIAVNNHAGVETIHEALKNTRA